MPVATFDLVPKTGYLATGLCRVLHNVVKSNKPTRRDELGIDIKISLDSVVGVIPVDEEELDGLVQ